MCRINHPYATQQQVQLETDVVAQLPPLEGGRELLHQTLVNLVLNVVQATPPGGSVTIRGTVESSSESLRITVADSGRGILPTDLPRIFDPFFTTRDDGTGLV